METECKYVQNPPYKCPPEGINSQVGKQNHPWMPVNILYRLPWYLLSEPAHKQNSMEARLEAKCGPKNMEFCSPRMPWRLPRLSSRPAMDNDQHGVLMELCSPEDPGGGAAAG